MKVLNVFYLKFFVFCCLFKYKIRLFVRVIIDLFYIFINKIINSFDKIIFFKLR